MNAARRALSDHWEPLALAAVVLAAATAYAWDLDIQRWANAYYSAIAQSGAESWRSFFFGSLDPGNATASDKPPAAFWVMALSVRAFGLSSWSLMLPQALETAATVVLLHRAVRRLAGPVPALVAAIVLASTPAVLALARYNHPDTLMTLLVVGAAYCCVRATQSEHRRWLVATGALLGLAFLTKWAVALLPAPSMAAALVVAQRRTPSDHLRRLGVLAATAAVTGLSWVVVVLALPAGSRPYADGSNGSILNLIVGRDGFSRLGGSLGAAPGNPVSGSPGLLRLLEAPFSAQIGWLLPLSLGLLVIVVVRQRGRPQAGVVMFGGWLVTTALAFSLMSGAMHPYYAVLLAPAQAAVIGLALALLRTRRDRTLAGAMALVTLAYGLAVATAYRVPAALVWLAAGLAVASVVAAGLARAARAQREPAVVSRLLAGRGGTLTGILLAAALAVGPLTVGLQTVAHPVTGSDPLAGPPASAPPSRYPADLMGFLRAHQTGDSWLAAVPRATAASLMQLQGDEPVLPLGGFTGHSGGPTLAQVKAWVSADRLRYVVLSPGWVHYPHDTPPALQHFAIASVLAWASRTGCPHHWTDSGFVVLDLEEGQCPVSSLAADAAPGPGAARASAAAATPVH
jgi:4-amino-4-deoxy-L-arabinose transferase-like glycosyltransferase